MKNKEIEAINNLNNILQNLPPRSGPAQQIKNNVDILVQGFNELDQEVKQKTFEVKNREQLLVQRDNLLVQKESVINQKTAEVQNTKQVLAQKEQKLGEFTKTVFVDSLNKLYPDSYPAKVEKWPDTLPMKKHVINNDAQVMEKNTAIYKPLIEKKEKETIKKEFVKSLNELYPDSYSIDPTTWFYKDGKPLPMKAHYDNNNYEVMVKNTKIYKKEIEEIKAKELEEAKILKKVILQKDQLILTKELEKQELAKQKEIEKQELLAQQELEKKEMLAQKEVELANKSLAKNQVIGELQEDIGLKEKEAYKLQIESLMKQVEFHKKESELKDKALEDAHEIVKQNKIINELQGKLLAFKDLSKHDETLQLELSVIHFKVEESILNGNVDEMKELSKYLSELMKEPIEKEESLDISELLNNLSPIVHGGQNQIVGNIIGNFDNQHITHSVLLNGEGSESYEII